MTPRRLQTERVLIALLGAFLAAFLVVPVASLVFGTSPRELLLGLSHRLVGPALRLSLLTTTASLALIVLLGTPLSWSLATARRPPRVVETLVQLPIVIPPAVAGVALLLAFGRKSPLMALVAPAGSSLAFTTTAVVLAEVFVAAPFYVQAATSAFRKIDPQILLVARSLGASPWRVFSAVAIPLSAPALVAGAAMSWARALGEFGATLMFAGNLETRTQTLPLAIYTALESDLKAATAISILLVCVALLILSFVRSITPKEAHHGGPP